MPLHKDIHITAEILSLLRAGFYAQIAFEGALARLNSTILPNGYLNIAHKAFDKLDVWLKDLEQNLPIFSATWTQAETFDAISAMNFLRDLQRDLAWIAPQFERSLLTPDLSNRREDAKLLAAGIIRSASIRNIYVETLSRIFVRSNAPEFANPLLAELEGTRQYVNIANFIVHTFSTDDSYNPDLCERLRFEASLVPCDMLASVHDINVMLNVFSKELTFEMAEIPLAESEPWAAAGISPLAAGYWRAYRFAPADYLTWSGLGISGAPLAANWRRVGFSPEDAIVWIREGITPALGKEWRAAGFTAARTASMLRRGIFDPKRAPSTEEQEGP